MSRDEIIELISSHRDRLTELKVKRLARFGSVAGGNGHFRLNALHIKLNKGR
jgi:predicted nucleotidyltransferase